MESSCPEEGADWLLEGSKPRSWRDGGREPERRALDGPAAFGPLMSGMDIRLSRWNGMDGIMGLDGDGSYDRVAEEEASMSWCIALLAGKELEGQAKAAMPGGGRPCGESVPDMAEL